MTEPARGDRGAATATARGGLPGLLDAWRSCRDGGSPSVLALVTGTSGSTYRKPGAMALLDERGLEFGAVSGGCLEPELERRARHVLATRRPASAQFDTSDDSDRIYGSGVGCLGRIETLLMPLPVESGAHLLASLERAVSDRSALRVSVTVAGSDLGAGEARDGTSARAWSPEGRESPAFVSAGRVFSFDVPRPPSLLLLGAGAVRARN
ncbi:MAG: XdhC family protein, partial [Thermoanaerobaculia bacterium]|nr:XdhC family protein [Thermoanaerobaculia bacterium]